MISLQETIVIFFVGIIFLDPKDIKMIIKFLHKTLQQIQSLESDINQHSVIQITRQIEVEDIEN